MVRKTAFYGFYEKKSSFFRKFIGTRYVIGKISEFMAHGSSMVRVAKLKKSTRKNVILKKENFETRKDSIQNELLTFVLFTYIF